MQKLYRESGIINPKSPVLVGSIEVCNDNFDCIEYRKQIPEIVEEVLRPLEKYGVEVICDGCEDYISTTILMSLTDIEVDAQPSVLSAEELERLVKELDDNNGSIFNLLPTENYDILHLRQKFDETPKQEQVVGFIEKLKTNLLTVGGYSAFDIQKDVDDGCIQINANFKRQSYQD